MIKSICVALMCFLAHVEASIFWEKLKGFFGELTVVKFQEVLAWQVAGLFIPLVAGPMRVVAYILWNIEQE